MSDTGRTSLTWFSVRCVFRASKDRGAVLQGRSYNFEERITLWRAANAEDAIAMAEAEAEEYANVFQESPDEYLGFAQCYELDSRPGNGSEVFSLIRRSDLEPAEYLDHFFDTGKEYGVAADE